ncbi:DUF1634 domain-containing protein [Chroococcidiopsis thermalis]|uniref:DUF1634 domain-containing protein n=1 Tax=Chroococcidiopsis thermalis (strain PCC 7203) TaxID=251229 RepID=K9U8L9_CHRTP|nr:DUF1634 domain-containing protein [Chroococcidiopsis thermalis]AFY90973.1 protein of unknown function DUF1634 [Chroococcidiopsis thermalis PCC 7203]
MSNSRARWTEHQIEQIVGNILRLGVILSASVVLLGGILYLSHYGMNSPNYQVFRGEPSELRTLPGIVKFALSFRRRGLIQFGLLLLIATPIVRVAFLAFAFAKQGDRIYVMITLIVLSTLLYSLVNSV